MFGIFRKSRNTNGMFEDEQWQVAQGEYEGRPIIVRFNAALRPFVGKTAHTLKIAFAIPLNEPSPGGLPSGVENEEINIIEEKNIRCPAIKDVDGSGACNNHGCVQRVYFLYYARGRCKGAS